MFNPTKDKKNRIYNYFNTAITNSEFEIKFET